MVFSPYIVIEQSRIFWNVVDVCGTIVTKNLFTLVDSSQRVIFCYCWSWPESLSMRWVLLNDFSCCCIYPYKFSVWCANCSPNKKVWSVSFVEWIENALWGTLFWGVHLSGPNYKIRTSKGTNQNSPFHRGPAQPYNN